MTVFGKPTFAYEAVPSTMETAADLVRAGHPAGTVVVARCQSSGRGRRGRAWEAPPDANVNCTIVCPAVAAERRWELAPLAGIAVVDALVETAPSVRPALRFPNDVMLEGRKCAGILVESVVVGGATFPLVGIGVNVRKARMPDDLVAKAISLQEAARGVSPSVDLVAQAVVEHFGAWWRTREARGFPAVAEAWNERRDTEALRAFRIGGVEETCSVAGISADGRVAVERPDGSILWVVAAGVVLGDD